MMMTRRKRVVGEDGTGRMQHLYYLICIVLLYDTMRRRLGNEMANAFTLELIEYTELWKWPNIDCNIRATTDYHS